MSPLAIAGVAVGWLLIAGFGLALCRAAAMGDELRARSAPTPRLAEVHGRASASHPILRTEAPREPTNPTAIPETGESQGRTEVIEGLAGRLGRESDREKRLDIAQGDWGDFE